MNRMRDSRPGRGRRLRHALALAVLVAGAACGIDTQDHPEPIDVTEVPTTAGPTLTVVPDESHRPGPGPEPTPTPTSPATPPPTAATPASSPAVANTGAPAR